jgi:hypothetical protein
MAWLMRSVPADLMRTEDICVMTRIRVERAGCFVRVEIC